ncbi:hypothetical protein ARMSODRAFT_948191, partial [Armillaria solidipes]
MMDIRAFPEDCFTGAEYTWGISDYAIFRRLDSGDSKGAFRGVSQARPPWYHPNRSAPGSHRLRRRILGASPVDGTEVHLVSIDHAFFLLSPRNHAESHIPLRVSFRIQSFFGPSNSIDSLTFEPYQLYFCDEVI